MRDWDFKGILREFFDYLLSTRGLQNYKHSGNKEGSFLNYNWNTFVRYFFNLNIKFKRAIFQHILQVCISSK